MLLPFVSAAAGTLEADAASFADINAEAVFLKQASSYTCTLCANTMLLRRAAVIRGDSDWKNITELTTRSTLWCEGVGMYYSYTYKNISVDSETISGSKTTTFKNLLAKHPEGIVIYDYAYPHAVLLTDYTDGKFYCADPANNTPKGRILINEALINVEDADCYWYVTTTLPSLSVNTQVKNNSSIAKTSMMLGDTVKLSGSASGGIGSYQYEYYVQTPSASSWTTLSSFSSSASYTYKPTATGNYKLKVAVKDSTGTKAEKTFSLTVNPNNLTNNSSLNKYSMVIGGTVRIQGAASGGSKSYKYEYSVKADSSSGWKVIHTLSADTYFDYTISAIGAYQIKVRVQDSFGATAEKILDLTVKSGSLVNNSSLSSAAVNYGDSITISGKAYGGTGSYKYAFYYKKSTSSVYQNLGTEFGSDTSVVLKPAAMGLYHIKAVVMDSSGNKSEKIFELNVKKPALVNNSTISATKIYLGDTVTIRAYSTGGEGGNQYAYEYKKTTTNAGVLSGAVYGSAKSATFKPASTGQYYVRAGIKDSSGAVSVKTFTVTVLPALANKSVISATSVKVGTNVSITGSASGGSGSYQYQVLILKPGSSSWSYVKSYNSTSSYSFKPGIKGKYQIKVNVKDSRGIISSKTFTLTVS